MLPIKNNIRISLINTAIVVVSVAFAGVLFEGVLRVFSFDDSLSANSATRYDVTVNALVSPLSPEEIEAFRWDGNGEKLLHRRSANRRLVYEMVPNAKISDMLYTNEAGFRDKPFTPEKHEDTFRIIVVGDSISFGWYEWLEETYPKILESMLNDNAGNGTKYEVYNMGVGGYNAEQEFEIVRTRAVEYDPDLIVLQYCINDDLVGMDSGLYDHFTRSSIKTVNLLMRIWKLMIQFQPGEDLLQRNYRRLVQWQQEMKVPIHVVFFPPLPATDLDKYNRHYKFCEDIGLSCLSLAPSYLPFEPEQVYRDMLHPNLLGHRIAAEDIFLHLLTTNVVYPFAGDTIEIPNFLSARSALMAGFKYLQDGEYNEMHHNYDQAIEYAPVYARYAAYSCFYTAQELHARNQYEEALYLSQQAYEWNPNIPNVLLEIARNIRYVSGPQKAIEAYKHFIEFRGEMPPVGKDDVELCEAWNALGNLYFETQQKTNAVEAWTKAIQCAPWFREAYDAVFALRRTAVSAYSNSFLTWAQETYPENYELGLLLADYYRSEQNYGMANQIYLSFIEKYSARHESYKGLLQSSRSNNNTEAIDRAINLLTWAQKTYPENYDIGLLLADHYVSEQKFKMANRIYLSLIERDSARHESYEGLFLSHEADNNLAGVKSILEQMAQEYPERLHAHHFLAIIYQQQKQYDLAEKKLIELCETIPEDIGFKSRLADIYFVTNKSDHAKATYAELLSVNPESTLFAERFTGLHNENELSVLIEFWSNLAKTYPNAVTPFLQLGLSLQRSGQIKESQEAFEQAARNKID